MKTNSNKSTSKCSNRFDSIDKFPHCIHIGQLRQTNEQQKHSVNKIYKIAFKFVLQAKETSFFQYSRPLINVCSEVNPLRKPQNAEKIKLSHPKLTPVLCKSKELNQFWALAWEFFKRSIIVECFWISDWKCFSCEWVKRERNTQRREQVLTSSCL